MALPLARLPRYLVLEPVSSVRLEVLLGRPSCELEVELENPRPGRSFLLMIGPQGGPVVQRVRLSGRAKIMFEPQDERCHVLLLANPQKELLVLRLRGRTVGRARAPPRPRRARATSAPSRPDDGCSDQGSRPRLTEDLAPLPPSPAAAGSVGPPLRRGRAKD